MAINKLNCVCLQRELKEKNNVRRQLINTLLLPETKTRVRCCVQIWQVQESHTQIFSRKSVYLLHKTNGEIFRVIDLGFQVRRSNFSRWHMHFEINYFDESRIGQYAKGIRTNVGNGNIYAGFLFFSSIPVFEIDSNHLRVLLPFLFYRLYCFQSKLLLF